MNSNGDTRNFSKMMAMFCILIMIFHRDVHLLKLTKFYVQCTQFIILKKYITLLGMVSLGVHNDPALHILSEAVLQHSL